MFIVCQLTRPGQIETVLFALRTLLFFALEDLLLRRSYLVYATSSTEFVNHFEALQAYLRWILGMSYGPIFLSRDFPWDSRTSSKQPW